jgi:hypothetical protein
MTAGGYRLTVEAALTIWKKAAPLWKVYHTKKAEGVPVRWSTPDNSRMDINDERRYVTIKAASVEIGCQTVARHYFEAAAQHYGWEFPE